MEWNPATFRDMDRPKGCHTDRSEKDENKYIICLYMFSRKNGTDELICKAEIGIDVENKHGCQARKEWGDELGDWV